jgi:hypothetical protein
MNDAGANFNADTVGEAEFELLADAMSRLSREHREQKRHSFVRLIKSSWCHPETPFEQRALFNKALDEFEDFHIRVLKVLRSGYTRTNDALPFDGLAERLFGTMADEQRSTLLYSAISVLCPTGYALVSRKGLGGEGKMLRGPFSPEWPLASAGYWLNPRGAQFLDFLQEPEGHHITAATSTTPSPPSPAAPPRRSSLHTPASPTPSRGRGSPTVLIPACAAGLLVFPEKTRSAVITLENAVDRVRMPEIPAILDVFALLPCLPYKEEVTGSSPVRPILVTVTAAKSSHRHGTRELGPESEGQTAR